MKRIVLGVALTLLVGLVAFGGLAFFGSGSTTAQGEDTWQLAGGDQGFNVAEWGTGKGPDVSIDDWIESMPDTCDIQIIERGLSFQSVMYRCPD